jgi:hypothetical protein
MKEEDRLLQCRKVIHINKSVLEPRNVLHKKPGDTCVYFQRELVTETHKVNKDKIK